MRGTLNAATDTDRAVQPSAGGRAPPASSALHNACSDDNLRQVSHRTADAMRAVGIGATDPVGNNRAVAVVDAGRMLREGADSRIRLTAVERVASYLVEAAVGDFGRTSVEAVCEEHGIDRRGLRAAALRLSQSLTPDSIAPSEFAAAVRAHVNSLDWRPTQRTVNTSIF